MKTYGQFILLLAVVFVIGMLAGAGLLRLLFLRSYEPAPNFGGWDPAPAYIYKGKVPQMDNYHVVLVPGDPPW